MTIAGGRYFQIVFLPSHIGAVLRRILSSPFQNIYFISFPSAGYAAVRGMKRVDAGAGTGAEADEEAAGFGLLGSGRAVTFRVPRASSVTL